MKKIIFIIFIVVVAVLLVVNMTKDIVINRLIIAAAKAATGCDVSIGGINTDLAKMAVDVNGIVIKNPAGFIEKTMADIPRIYVRGNLPALARRRIHIKELKLVLRQFFIIKNSDGKINIDSLNFIKKESAKPVGNKTKKKKSAKSFDFMIDKLQLSIGQVVYRDYTSVPVKVMEFDIDIKDEVYHNVTDLKAIAGIVVARALARTDLADILGYNLLDIHNKVAGVVQKGIDVLTKTTKDMIEKTKEAIEGLFKGK